MNITIPQLREGWSTFFLAWLLVMIAAFALYQADLTQGMEILLYASSWAFIAGFALAYSNFSGRTAFIYSLVYGLFTIGYLLGKTYLPHDMPWDERIGALVSQQQEWIAKLVGGGTNRNSSVFAAHTSAIFWLLGYSAAWYTFRNPRVWRVVLPSGILLLSVVYYYFGPKPLYLYLTVYLITGMLYISRTYLAEQEQGWRQAAVRYDRTTSFNFLRGGFILAILVLLGAWTMPTLSASTAVNDALSGVNQPLRRFQDNWTRLYSSLRSYGGGVNDPYADSLALGGPRNVSDSLIMDIYVEEQLPFAYWQSTIFQDYEDGQWRVPQGERVIHIPDDGFLTVPSNRSREEVQQIVLNFLPNSGILYGLPEVVGADRQMFVTRQLDERGANVVNLIQSRYILQQGDQYQITSRMSVADEKSLREAGTLYPSWTVPYLQVPTSITAETLALAADLTTPYDNPYDKTIAVQNYLRANIQYNDQIEAPPNNVEPIHYVLFDLKEGYCNYYASAMVIMLRSQGIPARVVAGYAAGQFIEDADVYRVRASDAHTWVEVYFPRYGWIQFEPTASINVIGRPTGEEGDTEFVNPNQNNPFGSPDRLQPLLDTELEDPNNFPNDNSQANLTEGMEVASTNWFSQFNPLLVWRVTAGLLVLVLSAVALYLANILNTRVETNIVQSFERLDKWSHWLGRTPHPAQTPYERADTLADTVPSGRDPIHNLARQFVLWNYSPTTSPETINPQAEWQTLRPLLIRHTIHYYWERVKGVVGKNKRGS